MDIIIRNGVIQEKESKDIHEIKNKAGYLKKILMIIFQTLLDHIMILKIVIFVFRENIIKLKTLLVHKIHILLN